MNPVVVLIAEDEELLSYTLSEAFIDAGYDVEVAHNGADAIALLEREHQRVKAVLADIRMAGKLTGWDVGHRARELSPTVAVVYMSGDSANEWPAKGVPNSIMLAKPFALDQPVTAVSTLLNHVPPTAQ
ncbi:response regulator [Devosia sp. RR2S18]|uniref:response regulator n=1 Tax=Devosia rhizosphaerae TaxID=3049774 RepID=UPI00253F77C6|nr:response regulator [Devosia sp. RR2S18]WIJ26594.1 response regulator [Devosia sp. RR2S18]